MEAIITLCVSVIGFFIIVPFPEDAKFLTEEEKALLIRRIEEDGGSVRHDEINLQRVLSMIADWKIWIWYASFNDIIKDCELILQSVFLDIWPPRKLLALWLLSSQPS